MEVDGKVTGAIDNGLLVFVGISKNDTRQDADYLVDRLLGLRIFPDTQGKLNRNVSAAGGSVLIVPNFTLYGDCGKGRRPSFDLAAGAEQAAILYNYFVERACAGTVPVRTGLFQASMQVYLVNDGPVTLSCDSASSDPVSR